MQFLLLQPFSGRGWDYTPPPRRIIDRRFIKDANDLLFNTSTCAATVFPPSVFLFTSDFVRGILSTVSCCYVTGAAPAHE